MKIAITGATGFIGSRLTHELSREHQLLILSRNPDRARKIFPQNTFPDLEFVAYTPTESGEWQSKIDGCDAVINLAGAPIAERWTPSYQQAIMASRQLGTRKIVEAIAQSAVKPQVLINPSAIGYYGSSETETFTETSPEGADFLAQVCQAWEAEAGKVKESGVRLVILRFGIVLGNGGALAKMIPAFKIFAGGPIGEGRQWFSWIHIDDLVNLIVQALERDEIEGTFNATAPNPVTMNELCATLGEVMDRPSWLPVPGIALKFLLGDGAQVVLEGQRVLPEKTKEIISFAFQYPTLKPALENIVNS